ncbi:MAG TPA: ABC transporter transmembrane domain-containing protein, partial [Hyphomicrobium sp.]|nr:ABC transporter transmembrane domain-containing protein [Hyphomicrobium sp.]
MTDTYRAPPATAHTTTLLPATKPDVDASVDKRRSLRPLMTLKPLILKYKGALAAALGAMIVSAVAMLVVPLAVRRMIDHGFGAQDGALVDNYFATLIGIGLVIAIASPLRIYFINWLGERVVADLRTKTFAHLARLGPSFFDANHSGEMMSRLTADTTQIKAVAGVAISAAARNLVMLIGALVMMFVTSVKLSLLV